MNARHKRKWNCQRLNLFENKTRSGCRHHRYSISFPQLRLGELKNILGKQCMLTAPCSFQWCCHTVSIHSDPNVISFLADKNNTTILGFFLYHKMSLYLGPANIIQTKNKRHCVFFFTYNRKQ